MLAPHGREQPPSTRSARAAPARVPREAAYRRTGVWPRGQTSVLIKPWREEALDFPAAAGALEASRDGSALHDDQRGDGLDLEAFEQVGPLLLGDPDDVERPVIPAALENLRQESLDSSAMSGDARMEE